VLTVFSLTFEAFEQLSIENRFNLSLRLKMMNNLERY
jgi:hypothetical protein